MKTSELTGAALDWAVAKCEGKNPSLFLMTKGQSPHHYSTDWAQGGPIIERGGITVGPYRTTEHTTGYFQAYIGWDCENMEPLFQEDGTTPLIAAMRCYVALKLGDEVEIPKELTE
jgi:hypothetical protein